MNQRGWDRYDAQLTTPQLVILDLVADSREDAAWQLASGCSRPGGFLMSRASWAKLMHMSTS